MFNTKASLYAIFQSFEDESSDEEFEDEGEMSARQEGNDKTAVMTSQLRHFVIQVSQFWYWFGSIVSHRKQEYLSSPLLFDPSQVQLDPPSLRAANSRGRKVLHCSYNPHTTTY